MRTILSNAAFLVGILLVIWGTYQLSPEAGAIVAGAILAVLGTFAGLGAGNGRPYPDDLHADD